MSKTIADAIAEIQETIQAKDAEVNALKRNVNVLCQIDGQSPLYPDTPDAGESSVKSRIIKLKPDEFTADKLMKAMRRYLEMRKAATPDDAPAKPEEITKALTEGGFDFKGKEAVASVSTSLGKSSHTFKRLDNSGKFALLTWYGMRPKRKATATTEGDDETDDESESPKSVAGSPSDSDATDDEGGEDE